jgi:signal peptidase I
MKKDGKLIVSTHILFPEVIDMLANGNQVKFTVSGNSMRPLIVDNRDQVLLTGTEGKRLNIGDIILYRTKYGKYILHRIYIVNKNGYRTIGDACLSEDGFVPSSDIIGKVVKIYRKGKEIDCNSLLWRSIFLTWLKLLPVRKYLLNLYIYLAHIKGMLKKKTMLILNRKETN